MPCPAIATGHEFLSSVLAHVDCQGRTIGAYGYGALADPSSTTSVALLGILSIFIALFGYRLLFGPDVQGRDVVGAFVRIGLMLALATSWPAWRTIGYDLVLNGPRDIARTIGIASSLPGSRNDMRSRLQSLDDDIVAVTIFGSGRLTGGVSGGADLGDAVSGIALSDQFALGTGRSAFLIGTIAPATILSVGAGLLLALAPVMAGLLLFAGTFGIFVGWIRGLVFCMIGALTQFIVQGVELAIFEPWAAGVLKERADGLLTPSAPTELFVLSLAFLVASIGLLILAARIAFHPSFSSQLIGMTSDMKRAPAADTESLRLRTVGHTVDSTPPTRAALISAAVADTMRREERQVTYAGAGRASPGTQQNSDYSGVSRRAEPSGSSARRVQRRTSASAQQRDRRS